MKQIIYKSLFVLCFLMSGVISINAQGSSAEKFLNVNNELVGWMPGGMSNDGRYIVCNNGNARMDNTVILWDTQSNEVKEIGTECWAYGISDDGKVIVGVFNHPDAVDEYGVAREAHGYYKDGTWHVADYYAGYGVEQGSQGGCIWCISPDGEWMGGWIPIAKPANGFGWYLRPCIWDKNGKIVKTFDVEGPKSYMATARAMSSDGTKVAGFSEIVDGEYLRGMWIPTYWTGLKTLVTIPQDVYKVGSGTFSGMNNSGSIAVGHVGESGLIVKEDGTIIKVGKSFSSISETGLAVGKGGVYSEELGYWELDDFLKNLHGLPAEGANVAYRVSDNGEYICITMSLPEGSFAPALVRIGGTTLPTIPTKVTLMGGENASTNVSWETPRFNGYNPIGYNVYRDGVKVNTAVITKLTFNDPTPVIGKNCYTVSAVFKYTDDSEELTSAPTEEQCVEIVGNDGCFSPKGLVADIEYNRTVNLTWKSPYPNYKSSRSGKGEEEEELVKIKPDILKSFSFGKCISITSDDEYIYGLSVFGKSKINKFTFDGTPSDVIALGNIAYRGLAYDGTKYYSVADNHVVAFPEIKIGCGSGADHTIIEGAKGFTRISYLPSLNDNKGGFEIGKFKENDNDEGTSYYLTNELAKIEGGGIKPCNTAIMGVTSYQDVIYVARRENASSKDMKIFLYNATTNEPTGEYIDLRDYSSLQIGANEQIWGIHTLNSSEGIPCLGVVFGTISGTRLAFLELAKMEGLIGYNVFRNDVKINTEPIANSYYTEKLLDANSYEYKVTALFEGDCESVKSDPVSITITPIGAVNEPKDIVTEAVRNNIIVSWKAPKHSAIPKLVGYNVFRNGVKINKEGEYITDLFYTDKDLALGEYKYEVNAFYNNSGESVKLSNTIKLDGFNPTLAPTELVASQEDRGGVDLTWRTPAMGDYEIKTWNNGNIEDCIGISEEGGLLYVATKWDAKDLSSVFNYTLTDIEFYAGNAIDYTFYIYVDDKLVGEQTIKAMAMDYNLMKLDNALTIEKGKTLMIACKVTHGAGELPIGISERNDAVGKGDLTSIDGKNWVSIFESEKFKATWAISARLMPYTLEAPKEIVGVEMEANTNKDIKIVGSEVMMRGMTPTAVFKNSEVIGYNVYKNNEKINTAIVSTESFKDASVDFTKNNCYNVEALFTADRKSPKSVEACTFGHCLTPSLSGVIKDGYPELTLSTPTDVVKNNELKFYNEENIDAIGLFTDNPYYALIKYTPSDLESFDGYKITAIKALIMNDECKLSLFIKQGDRVILNKIIKNSDISVGEMNNFKMDNEITIDGSKSLMIGIKVEAAFGKYPIAIDAGPGVSYKGDVISFDAVNMTSLKESSSGAFDANWNISATIEASMPLGEKNIGYNIYRDDVKINEEAFVGTTYVDKTAEIGKIYSYFATALWDTNCESEASTKVSIGLVGVNDIANTNVKVYPNPAKDILNIEGDVETVRFYNSVGQECSSQQAAGGKLSVDVSAWAKGIYIIEVTSATGKVSRGKAIIN